MTPDMHAQCEKSLGAKHGCAAISPVSADELYLFAAGYVLVSR